MGSNPTGPTWAGSLARTGRGPPEPVARVQIPAGPLVGTVKMEAPVFLMEAELCWAIESTCRRAGCEYAILFGSSARGEREYSDIDLAVKFSTDPTRLASRLAMELEEKLEGG